jgi:ribosomal protein S18 acetylase RimI-like enzyme
VSDLTIRTLTAADAALYETYPGRPVPGMSASAKPYLANIASGAFRPDWTYVAVRDGQVVARAVFTGPPDAAHPWSMARFDPGTGDDRVDVGASLARFAYGDIADRYGQDDRPRYTIYLPPDWRGQPHLADAVGCRQAAVEAAGLSVFVERYNFRWTASDPRPARSNRLTFRAATDDELLDVIRRIDVDTLDAYSLRDIARLGPTGAARLRVDDLLDQYDSPRDWWLLGCDARGQVVGLVVAASVDVGVSGEIGFIGVAAEHRGHGYCDDLIAEGTYVLTESGAATIDLNSDRDNTPIVAAWHRNGYHATDTLLVFT